MSLWILANIDLQTAAEGRTFVKKYVDFLTSFWTGRRFSAILLNQVFVLYVFYHVLRSAPYPADGQRHRDTIKGFRAQPPGKPVRMRIKMAAEVQTFVKEYVDFLTSLWTLVRINLQTAAEVRTFVQKYVNFLTSFWTGRRFSAILLNRVFVLYVFYHVLRSAPYPADRQTHRDTDN